MSVFAQVRVHQCPTRALFQLSRRDREYLSFNLVSETGSRISFFRSHASRRDRDFLSFNLVLRDKHENFFLSISCFEMSTRIFPPNLRLRDESEKFCHFVSVFETRTGFFSGFHFCITFIFYKDEYTRLSRSWMKVKVVCLGVQPVLSFGHLQGFQTDMILMESHQIHYPQLNVLYIYSSYG